MDAMELRCNFCEEMVNLVDVSQHVAGKNHGIKKRVAEFRLTNAQIGSKQQAEDISVIDAWIRNLHASDFMSGR
ncbi:MAG: hypothetical protein DA330_04425 [Nitrososphaera sp.]|nr:hypothetical protein [Nitrososphaera sp.]